MKMIYFTSRVPVAGSAGRRIDSPGKRVMALAPATVGSDSPEVETLRLIAWMLEERARRMTSVASPLMVVVSRGQSLPPQLARRACSCASPSRLEQPRRMYLMAGQHAREK